MLYVIYGTHNKIHKWYEKKILNTFELFNGDMKMNVPLEIDKFTLLIRHLKYWHFTCNIFSLLYTFNKYFSNSNSKHRWSHCSQILKSHFDSVFVRYHERKICLFTSIRCFFRSSIVNKFAFVQIEWCKMLHAKCV